MDTQTDGLGDLLRDFYSAYGAQDEGPPHALNVSQMLPGVPIAEGELDVLRKALSDAVLRQQFLACRAILEDLSTRLTREDLLQELMAIPLPSDHALEQLSSGVLWFALAASLDAREMGLPVTPLDGTIDLPLPMRVQMTVQGSLVLRLYVALVYMREGVLNNLIATSSRAGGPCSASVRKLLNCDYVRRIRNALSHGSFSACLAGIVFSDDRGAIVATPGFLSWLSAWLMLIQLQALAACSRKPHLS